MSAQALRTPPTRLQPPGEQEDDEDEDDEGRAAAEIMVPGAEAITTAADEEKNEEDDEDVHGVVSWFGTWRVSCSGEAGALPEYGVHTPSTSSQGSRGTQDVVVTM